MEKEKSFGIHVQQKNALRVSFGPMRHTMTL